MGKKIDFMIIGAQKAGTSSLTYYLAQHPNLLGHTNNEFVYFFQDDIYSKGIEKALSDNYDLNKITNDTFLLAKNVMVMYDEKALKRLYEYNKDVKLVIMLRNPVSRAYSSFWFAKSTGRETAATFEEALGRAASGSKYIKQNLQYLEMGKYAEYIRQVFNIFPKQNIKIIIFEDFIKQPNKALAELMNFFNMPQFDFDTSKKVNEATEAKSELVARFIAPGKKGVISKILPVNIKRKIRRLVNAYNSKPFSASPITPETKTRLQEYYKEYNSALEKTIERDLKIWN